MRRYELQLLRERSASCVVVSEADRINAGDRLVPDVALLRREQRRRRFVSPPLPRSVGGEQTVLSVGGMSDPYNRDAALYFLR